MGKDKRVGWLKELKPGDAVIFNSHGWGTGCTIGEVVNVTPTGRIKVNVRGVTYVFDQQGYEYGGSSYNTASIRRATDEAIAELRATNRINTLKYKCAAVMERRNHIEWDVGDLERVWDVLKRYEEVK